MNIVKYCLLGNVDASKSTLLGVLKSGELDDGKGKSRSSVLQLKHEKQSGNTTNSNMIKIYQNKEFINKDNILQGQEILNKTSLNEQKKCIQLIDLPGHNKYFRTTLRGVMEHNPSYAIVIISAHKGIEESIKTKGYIIPNMTKIHFQVCAFLRIPMLVVISKIDNCPKDRLELTVKEVKDYIKKMGIKDFYHVKNNDTLSRCKQAYFDDKADMFIPYFKISNVTGEGLDLLTDLLFNTPIRNFTKDLNNLKEFTLKNNINIVFDIYKSYYVKGIGIIVFGCLKLGNVSRGDKLKIGPFSNGYIDIRVRSLHNDERNEIETLTEGTYGCMAITTINNKDILYKNKLNKGKIITDKGISVTAIETECKIGHHKTTIQPKFSTYIHTCTVETSAKISTAEKFPIRGGEKANITFVFSTPQFTYPGNRFVFRDDTIKGHGLIKNIITE